MKRLARSLRSAPSVLSPTSPTISSAALLVLVAILSVPALAVAQSAAPKEMLSKSAEVSSEAKIPFRFENGEILAMIAAYSKASGKKFIVDPGVRGKISVFLPGDVTLDEAYNILMESLSINGFTIIDAGDTSIVKSARSAQRDGIPTVTKLPPPKPNRMVTMTFTPKYVSVEELNKRLRILPSKDGEMTPFEPTNSLIISDYAANINRIAEIIAQIDTPAAAKWKAPARPAASKSNGGAAKTPNEKL